jgi:hypothetical protein
MRYVLGGAFAFMLAIVQASSVEQFHILGVAPNLMLVMLVSWLVVRGLEDVLPMIAVSGITLGLVGLQTPGLVLLALLAPLALLGVVRELKVIHSETVLIIALVLGSSLLYESIMLAGVMATGGVFQPLQGITEVVLPAAIVNLAIALPVYLLMRLARPAAPRRRNAYSF